MRFEATSLAAALGLALLGSGCATAPPAAPERPVVVHAGENRPDAVVGLLEYVRQLDTDTPEARAQAVVDARTAVNRAPGARSYAQLALAYGRPEQTRYTPDLAARYAERALSADDADWSAAAAQYLRDYARLYTLITSEDVPGSAPADRSPAAGSNPQRIADLEARLAEAHRKLREMADIEDRLSTGNR